jgi:ATP-binding cassette subfamily F protein uup
VGTAAAGATNLLLRDFSYDFSPEDRVGIIGPNGAGKSSLLDVIAGRRAPCGGRLELGATVKLAYFDQHSAVLRGTDLERKVIDVVQEAASRVEVDGVELSASQLLERFLFPPAQQHQPVARLSGGERRRLHLCRLLIEAPNVLLLDEPTNDLDVATLAVLEDFLEDFRGCVVVVSHDRWFLDRCVDRLFCFRDGMLQRHEGTYSDYLEQERQAPPRRPGSARRPSGRAARQPSPRPEAPRRRSFRECRELEAIERDLPVWEARRGELERTLQAGTVTDYGEMERLTTELADLVARIAAAEDRWLALSELPA